MQHLRSIADDRLKASAELGLDMVGDLNTAQSPSEVEQAMSVIVDLFDPSQINAEA